MSVSRQGQLIEVHYDDVGSMAPAAQAALIQQIRDAAQTGPVALLFVVGVDARVVDPRVPGFWLDQTRDPSLRISAMAIVSSRLAVRIAASAFRRASGVLGMQLQVNAFEDLASARAWLGSLPKA